MSSCGHCIHLKCLNTYVASSMRRNNNGFSPDQGEMICPLCKFLANTFLPYDYHDEAAANIPDVDTSQALQLLTAPRISLGTVPERCMSPELSISYIFFALECNPTKESFDRSVAYAAELHGVWAATATTIKVHLLRHALGSVTSSADVLTLRLLKDTNTRLRSFYENRTHRSFVFDIIDPLTLLLYPRDREMKSSAYLICPPLPLAQPPYPSSADFFNAAMSRQEDKMYPLLLYPLLIQDLHVLAVALYDTECLVLLALARLVQLLASCKNYVLPAPWECLRGLCCLIHQHTVPIGCLDKDVMMAWQNYLCFTHMLRTGESKVADGLDAYAMWSIAFPHCLLSDLLASQQFSDLVVLWCKDYSKYCSAKATDEVVETSVAQDAVAEDSLVDEPPVLQSMPPQLEVSDADADMNARQFMELMRAAMMELHGVVNEDEDDMETAENFGFEEEEDDDDEDEDWDNMQDGVGDEVNLDGVIGTAGTSGRQDCVFPWKLQGVDPKCDILTPYYNLRHSQQFLQRGLRAHNFHIVGMQNKFSLIELPKLYTDLYQQVEEVYI